MPAFKKIIPPLITALALVALVVLMGKALRRSFATTYDCCVAENVNGVVVQKYIAKTLIIVLRTPKGNFYHSRPSPELWAISQIGDSLVKVKGDSMCVLIRGDTVMRIRYVTRMSLNGSAGS